MEDHDVRTALQPTAGERLLADFGRVADFDLLCRYSEILDYHNVKPDEEGFENGVQQQ